jgi:hypothetical protein
MLNTSKVVYRNILIRDHNINYYIKINPDVTENVIVITYRWRRRLGYVLVTAGLHLAVRRTIQVKVNQDSHEKARNHGSVKELLMIEKKRR